MPAVTAFQVDSVAQPPPIRRGGWVIRDQLEALGRDARQATDHAVLACYVGQHADRACGAQLEQGRRPSATVDLMFEFLVNR